MDPNISKTQKEEELVKTKSNYNIEDFKNSIKLKIKNKLDEFELAKTKKEKK
jgi:hypothetical protein